MTTTLDQVRALPHVLHVDDERALDNGIIVTLKPGIFFVGDPGCGVRGFDTIKETVRETNVKKVYRKEN